MKKELSHSDGETLRERIEAMPEDSVLFRSDFPEYHSEFVGGTLAELVKEGILVKLAQGIYAKPRQSRFGTVLPSVNKVVKAIAARDKAEVLPSGGDSIECSWALYPSSYELHISDNRQ